MYHPERRGDLLERVLIAASNEKTYNALVRFLGSCGVQCKAIHASSGAEARRALVNGDFGMILINAPLPDEFGHELAQNAARNTVAGVMLLVKAESLDSVTEEVESYGGFVIPKPLPKAVFMQALHMARATKARLSGLMNENRKLQKRIEDIRLVDRAKCLLIECCSMTEPEAHSYIEHRAMDLRLSKRQVAQDIINGEGAI